MAAMQEKASLGVARKRKRGKKRSKNRAIRDSRFEKVHSDPRFSRLPPQQNKVKVDERFSGLFNDPLFQQRAKIDRWGRKIDVSEQNEEMDRLYELDRKDKSLRPETALPLHEGDILEGLGLQEAGGEKSQAGSQKKSPRGSPNSSRGKSTFPTNSQSHQRKATKRKLSEISKENMSHTLVDVNDCISDSKNSESSDKGDDKESMSPAEIKHRARQVARMRGVLEGSSSEESDSADEPLTDEEVNDAEVDVASWGIGAFAGNPDEDVLECAPTKRIAVVDLDWENIRAVDILHIMRSFLPSTGKIERVVVYISDYGQKRIAEEEKRGPGALGLFDKAGEKHLSEGVNRPMGDEIESISDDDEKSSSSDEGDDVDVEQLRVYEKSKLRYYYAAVECDSTESAAHLVQELDGKEFEKSHCIFDLRYIPDEMDLSTCPCRDSAVEVPDEYEPPSFECHAMTKTNLKLSWDNDDPYRKKQIRRKFKEEDLLKEDFKVYLASDSDEDSDEQNTTNDIETIRNQYRAAFGKLEDSSSSHSESISGSDSENGSRGVENLSTTDASELEEIPDTRSPSGADTSSADDHAAEKHNGSDAESSGDEEDIMHQEGPPRNYLTHEPENEVIFEMPSSGIESTGAVSKSNARKKSNGASHNRSKAELDLLLLDDKALQAARKGTGLLPKSENSKGQKLTKKERIRLSKLQRELKKHGSDEDDAEDKDFQIDLSDARFQKMFSSADYAIEPTHPAFKTTKGSEGLMKEVVKLKGSIQHQLPVEKSDLVGEARDYQEGSDLHAMVKKLKKKYHKTSS